MIRYLLLALAALILWAVLAFGLALPTGWVHVPLILGAVLIAAGIVESGGKSGPK
jgi:1,4-dihydroxy-2-naphthoate octaprenyltransferase